MNKRHLMSYLLALILLVAVPVAYASVDVLDDGTRKGESIHIDFRGSEVAFDGSTSIVYSPTWTSTGQLRKVNLPLKSWLGYAESFRVASLTATEAVPHSYENAASPLYISSCGVGNFTSSNGPTPDFIVWPGFPNATAGGGAATQFSSPIEFTFVIPSDYASSGYPVWTVLAQNASHIPTAGGSGAPPPGSGTSDVSATPNYIGWEVIINRAGAAISTVRYALPYTALVRGPNLQNVSLTYPTANELLAGDLVTLRIWRVYHGGSGGGDVTPMLAGQSRTTTVCDATSDLRVYNVSFTYTASW